MSGHGREPEFVTIGDTPVQVGRASDSGLRLFHPTVSRNHATLTRTADGFTVLDCDSRYGTFVNGVRVRSVGVQVGDRIQFGTMTAYRVCAEGLRLDAASRGASITVAGITVVKAGRTLVKDASFSIQPDTFVGILGPSGAGKSTILNCLASYHQAGDGRIVFDDQRDVKDERDQYRAILGHVPQDDIMYLTLTVRENLTYAARLRLDATPGAAEIEEAVTQALERVGLTEHADKPAAVLSGGQRKRLSVAVELLKRPRILLLDEPTSGLDPASEANLMEQLRYVASRGTTVVCTTHLMDNVRLFDTVVALGVIDGVGRIAFVGPPGELLGQFQCRNFADLYDRLSAGQFSPLTSVGGQQVQPAREPESRPSSTAVPGAAVAKPASNASGSLLSGRSLSELVTRTMADSTVKQFLTVGERGLLSIWRDPGLWLMMLAQPLFLGTLVALTQFDPGAFRPVCFFTAVISIWLGLNNSARDLVRDRKHYVRERLSGLAPGAYLAAKGAVFALIGVIQLVLLLVVIRLGCAQVMAEGAAKDLQATSMIWFLLIMLVCYASGLGLGLLISALARTEEAAVAALPLLIMPQLLLSALAVSQVSESYSKARAFKPLVVMLTKGQDLPAAGQLVDCMSLLCYSRPGSLLLESPKVTGYSQWIWLGDFCHLCILSLATWLALYLVFLRAEQKWPRLIGLG